MRRARRAAGGECRDALTYTTTRTPPMFFASADSKEVTGADLGSADSKGFTGGRLRPRHGETRSWLGSADSKGVREGEVKEVEEVEEVKEREISRGGRDDIALGGRPYPSPPP